MSADNNQLTHLRELLLNAGAVFVAVENELDRLENESVDISMSYRLSSIAFRFLNAAEDVVRELEDAEELAGE